MEQKELFTAIETMLGGMEARLKGEIIASEERMIRLIDEKITASEGRMVGLIDEKITASEGRMRVDLSSTEERIKRHVTSNNIEIGTIITEALENMNEDVDRIKTDIAVLRVNDAQKTIDLVKLSQAR